MTEYCRTDCDVRRTLIRIVCRKIPRPLFAFICNACNLVLATGLPAVLIDREIYCEPDAFKKARTQEPALAEDDFKRRLRPYDGVSQLFRYESVS